MSRQNITKPPLSASPHLLSPYHVFAPNPAFILLDN
jgi:hypothetical protein